MLSQSTKWEVPDCQRLTARLLDEIADASAAHPTATTMIQKQRHSNNNATALAMALRRLTEAILSNAEWTEARAPGEGSQQAFEACECPLQNSALSFDQQLTKGGCECSQRCCASAESLSPAHRGLGHCRFSLRSHGQAARPLGGGCTQGKHSAHEFNSHAFFCRRSM